jgi:allene oxide cyclase
MLRRWKRRLFWAAVLVGLALLAIPATVAQAAAAVADSTRRRQVAKKVVPLLAVLALAAVVGGATLASAASSATSQSLTLVAVDIPKSERYVDLGAKGNGPGDVLFFRETLREGGKRAGHSEVMCVTVARDVGRCQGTLFLAGGTLEASGAAHFDARFSLPIVGGTGRYAGARGELQVIALDSKRSRYAIALAE